MKLRSGLVFALLLFAGAAHAAPHAHLHPQVRMPRLFAQISPCSPGPHCTVLSWTLSVDDTTASCTTTANCLQNVYRANGACSTTSGFTLLTTTALSATATGFTDQTVTPGVWCYGASFSMNGLESNKDTVQVSLQPASQTGMTGVPH